MSFGQAALADPAWTAVLAVAFLGFSPAGPPLAVLARLVIPAMLAQDEDEWQES